LARTFQKNQGQKPKRQYQTDFRNDVAFCFAVWQGLASPALPQRLGDIGKHIFDKDPVPRGRVADQHVRDRPHELAVLNDGRAAHECGQ